MRVSHRHIIIYHRHIFQTEYPDWKWWYCIGWMTTIHIMTSRFSVEVTRHCRSYCLGNLCLLFQIPELRVVFLTSAWLSLSSLSPPATQEGNSHHCLTNNSGKTTPISLCLPWTLYSCYSWGSRSFSITGSSLSQW